MRKTDAIINEVKKVIVGKDDVIAKVLMTVLGGGHILLEDVPGVGKTQLALAFSRAMDLSCHRMQFTPDTMASDITGFSVYNRQKDSFEYKEGAVLCNLFLADEINRTSPKTQSALLEVMEEGGVTVDGVTHKVPQPFVCIATQNPIGSAGTQNLPDSQLDRFMVKLSMGYPSTEAQVDIIKQRHMADPLDTVERVVSRDELMQMMKEVQACYISDEVTRYGVELCEKTRTVEESEQGVSPRAVLALVAAAKASAYCAGRDFVIPEDIKNVFVEVCSHRIILTAKARIKKVTAKSVLEGILAEVNAPKMTEK